MSRKNVSNLDPSQQTLEKQQRQQFSANDSHLELPDVHLSDIEKNPMNVQPQIQAQKPSNLSLGNLSVPSSPEWNQGRLRPEQAEKYFKQLLSSVAGPSRNISELHQQSILSGLKTNLKKGDLKIEAPKPFPVIIREKDEVEQAEERRKDLEKKKKQAIDEMKRIEQEENNLRIKASSVHERRVSSIEVKKMPSTQEKKELKRVLREFKNFNREVEARDEELRQVKEKMQMENLQKYEDQLRQRRESKREEVKSHLQSIVERERVRKSMVEDWRQKQKEIKNTKYLYLTNRGRDELASEEKEAHKLRVLERLKDEHKFDRESIEEHEQKYLQSLEERKEASKSLYASRMSEVGRSRAYEETQFRKRVRRELEELKKVEIQRAMKVRENEVKEKMEKYNEFVNQQIKPRLHYKKFVPLPRCMSVDTLEPKAKRELGLKYLEGAKKMKHSASGSQLQEMKRQSEERLKASKSSHVYKDYLKEIKEANKDKRKLADPTEERLNEILERKKVNSNYQSLRDAKHLSEMLIEKSKHVSGPKRTMLEIQHKINILNAMD